MDARGEMIGAMTAVYMSLAAFALGLLAGWMLKAAAFAHQVGSLTRAAGRTVRDCIRRDVCPQCRTIGLFAIYPGCWKCDACGWQHADSELLQEGSDGGEGTEA